MLRIKWCVPGPQSALSGLRTRRAACSHRTFHSRFSLKPIERSHYERVHEVAITLRETSQSRRLQVDQDLAQAICS